MKISNNFLAVLVVIFILFSLSNTLNNLGIIVTGKASDSGTASLEVLPFTLSTPSNFQAFVNIDYESINLNWTVVSEADYYVIYYSSNLTEINALNISDISAGITNTSKIYSSNWTDSTAAGVEKRFYRVASILGSAKNLSNQIVGKYDIEIWSSTGVAGVMEGNVISLPLISENNSIDYIVRAPSFDDRIIIYNRTSDTWMLSRYWGPAWGWWGAEFTDLNVDRGYWFTIVGSYYNITNVGDVRTEDLTIDIQQSTGVSGVMEGNVMGWNLPVRRCNLSALIQNESFDDRIIIYNRTSDTWMLSRYWGPAWGWWGAEFDCFEPGRGYWFIIVGSSYNWTQEGI